MDYKKTTRTLYDLFCEKALCHCYVKLEIKCELTIFSLFHAKCKQYVCHALLWKTKIEKNKGAKHWQKERNGAF